MVTFVPALSEYPTTLLDVVNHYIQFDLGLSHPDQLDLVEYLKSLPELDGPVKRGRH